MEEGYIASALVNIKDRSLGFATYQEIYTEDNVLEEDLRSKIIDAYTSFINLAIEAIRYYKSRGAGEYSRLQDTTFQLNTKMTREDSMHYRPAYEVQSHGR